MVSEGMIEDQSEGSLSNTVKSARLNDQFASGDEFAPKVRKPYTITKQRERWTEEEHKKFLEALKLYGRAWRRIEEHVGTKTAVQIRSHAQKFFSKVVRESSSGDGAEVKAIEIPPPRPKRKPMHPYPRKLSAPLKSGADRPRSNSPNSSGSDQENQSPTSVLSAVCSEAFAMGDSCSPNGEDSCSPNGDDSCPPNGGASPASSANGMKPSRSSQSEPDLSPDEDSPPTQEDDSSAPVKLDLCWENKGFAEESSPESSSTQSLKLFGKTVLVTDSHRPSSPSNGGTGKPLLPDTSEDKTIKSLPYNLVPMSAFQCGEPVYYIQFLSENKDSNVASSSTTPWWSLYGGLSYPFLQPNNSVVAKEQDSSANEQATEKETQKECSLTDSNTGSLSLGGGDRNWDADTQSDQAKEEKNWQGKAFLLKASEGSAFVELRGNRKKDKCIKGFVPYKRCLADRDTHSSILTGEEREEQRIRLCL